MPEAIGVKNKKFFLGFLKKLPIASKHFSYKLKATKRALPERPGIILKIPTTIPLIKLIIVNYMKNLKI